MPRLRDRAHHVPARRYSFTVLLTGWVAIGVSAVLVVGVLYGYIQYRAVWDGINHVAVSGLGPRPPKYDNSLNVLVIGSDSRAGANARAGGGTAAVRGQRSDTVMVLHISPGRRRVAVISFPRDTAVPVFRCAPEPGFGGQAAQPGAVERLNWSFAFGGPGCLWKTIEQTTRIRLDDFIQLDFTGFIRVINALGGVEVCLPYAIRPTSYDPLRLTAGPHLVKGRKALLFWRDRDGIGVGSDLQRIQRDQLLMVALVQKVLSTRLLSSLPRTLSIIKSIVGVHAITTDTGLDQNRLVSIAVSLAGIDRTSVQFVEVPTVGYPGNGAMVEYDPAQAPGLFAAVAHDNRLPKLTSRAGPGGEGGRPAPAARLLTASQVSVEVLNGSGVSGIAGATAAQLTARGFHVLGASTATTPSGTFDFGYTESVVAYSSAADLPAARTVAAQLTHVRLKLDASVPAGTVRLTLGSDFTALLTKPRPIGTLAKRYHGYSGATNICKGYGTAFAG